MRATNAIAVFSILSHVCKFITLIITASLVADRLWLLIVATYSKICSVPVALSLEITNVITRINFAYSLNVAIGQLAITFM